MNERSQTSQETIASARRVRLSSGRAIPVALLGIALCLLSGNAFSANDDPKPWELRPLNPLAEVASVIGVVEATDRDAQRRTLSVGDPVYSGERVWVRAGASAGLWIGDALIQLEEKSGVSLVATTQGGARVTLQNGAVRIVDSRTAGPAIELVALGASTRIVGGDREARILKEKTGPYALFGDWAGPFSVMRGSDVATAGAGDSIVANNREPLFGTSGHPDRIDLLGGAPSLADAGPSTDVGDLLGTGAILPSVSAGPGGGRGGVGGGAIMAVPGLPLQVRSPCGTIRRDCGAGAAGGGRTPTVIIEQPPTTTPFPGATNTVPTTVEQQPTTGGFPGATNTPTQSATEQSPQTNSFPGAN